MVVFVILSLIRAQNTELLVSLAQIANVSVDVPNDVLMELLTSFFNPEMLEFVSQSKDETFLSVLCCVEWSKHRAHLLLNDCS